MGKKRRKDPGRTGVFTIKDITDGNVKDSQGQPCPDKTITALNNAGVISISGKVKKLKWNTIESDALDLQEDLGTINKPQ